MKTKATSLEPALVVAGLLGLAPFAAALFLAGACNAGVGDPNVLGPGPSASEDGDVFGDDAADPIPFLTNANAGPGPSGPTVSASVSSSSSSSVSSTSTGPQVYTPPADLAVACASLLAGANPQGTCPGTPPSNEHLVTPGCQRDGFVGAALLYCWAAGCYGNEADQGSCAGGSCYQATVNAFSCAAYYLCQATQLCSSDPPAAECSSTEEWSCQNPLSECPSSCPFEQQQ